MQHVRTQPAGPKAFRLYSMVRDTYRQAIGERAFSVYEALTYYVHPKTLEGTIPLKLLAETVRSPLTTVSRCLHRLWQEGLITITPQWDDYGCVPKANLYTLHTLPLKPMSRQPAYTPSATPPERSHQAPHLTVLRRSGLSRPHEDMPGIAVLQSTPRDEARRQACARRSPP